MGRPPVTGRSDSQRGLMPNEPVLLEDLIFDCWTDAINFVRTYREIRGEPVQSFIRDTAILLRQNHWSEARIAQYFRMMAEFFETYEHHGMKFSPAQRHIFAALHIAAMEIDPNDTLSSLPI